LFIRDEYPKVLNLSLLGKNVDIFATISGGKTDNSFSPKAFSSVGSSSVSSSSVFCMFVVLFFGV
jgi:hypothetical protein